MTTARPLESAGGASSLPELETIILPANDLWNGMDYQSMRLPSGRHVQLPNTWRHPRDETLTRASKAKGVGLLAMAEAPLVGRMEERDVIWASLLTSIQKGLRVVLIQGPSGIQNLANGLGCRSSVYLRCGAQMCRMRKYQTSGQDYPDC